MTLMVTETAQALGAGLDLLDDRVVLDMGGGYVLALRSNSAALLDRMRDYFGHVVTETKEPQAKLIAWERDPVHTGFDFIDWAREPGKTGRKDSYADVPGGRLVRKVRTGMVFLQSADHIVAAGPCLENDNQVINFINSQLMNHLQHQGAMICHASGLVRDGAALGLAGFSGGGKSTLMLHMMEDDATAFLTNDRLFVRQGDDGAMAQGIPKLPRINPGTALNNPRLEHIVDEERRRELRALSLGELWDVEEKYDVDVARLYGPDRICHTAPLGAFLILNWSRDSDRDAAVTEIDIAQRRDLLAAVMKSPGPFYQRADGTMYNDSLPFDEAAYLDAFKGVRFFEVTGRIDFDGVAQYCLGNVFEGGAHVP